MHLSGGPVLLPDGLSNIPAYLWHGAAATQLYFLPALFLVRCATLVLHPMVSGRPLATVILAASILVIWRLVIEPMLPHPTEGTEPLLASGFGLGFAALGWAIAEAEIAGPPKKWWLVAAVLLLGGMVGFTAAALAM